MRHEQRAKFKANCMPPTIDSEIHSIYFLTHPSWGKTETQFTKNHGKIAIFQRVSASDRITTCVGLKTVALAPLLNEMKHKNENKITKKKRKNYFVDHLLHRKWYCIATLESFKYSHFSLYLNHISRMNISPDQNIEYCFWVMHHAFHCHASS